MRNQEGDMADQIAKIREALEAFIPEWEHFCDKINFGKTFIDAKAIQWMNEYPSKVVQALIALDSLSSTDNAEEAFRDGYLAGYENRSGQFEPEIIDEAWSARVGGDTKEGQGGLEARYDKMLDEILELACADSDTLEGHKLRRDIRMVFAKDACAHRHECKSAAPAPEPKGEAQVSVAYEEWRSSTPTPDSDEDAFFAGWSAARARLSRPTLKEVPMKMLLEIGNGESRDEGEAREIAARYGYTVKE
jgi:hypothetical protein